MHFCLAGYSDNKDSKKNMLVFLLSNATLQVVRHTLMSPWKTVKLSCILGFSLKRQKEFWCCLVWWKENLEFYKTWCMQRGIPKLHCWTVKVYWLSFNWLLGRFESKNLWFFLANSRQRAASYQIQSANWFISAVGFNHQWIWNIYICQVWE